MRGLLFTERIVETLPATCDWNWFVDGLWFVQDLLRGLFRQMPPDRASNMQVCHPVALVAERNKLLGNIAPQQAARAEVRNFEIVRAPQCWQRHPVRCSTCWLGSYPCHARGKFRSLNRFMTFFLCSGFLSPAQALGGYACARGYRTRCRRSRRRMV
jgi:hypothetical protein